MENDYDKCYFQKIHIDAKFCRQKKGRKRRILEKLLHLLVADKILVKSTFALPASLAVYRIAFYPTRAQENTNMKTLATVRVFWSFWVNS